MAVYVMHGATLQVIPSTVWTSVVVYLQIYNYPLNMTVSDGCKLFDEVTLFICNGWRLILPMEAFESL